MLNLCLLLRKYNKNKGIKKGYPNSYIYSIDKKRCP